VGAGAWAWSCAAGDQSTTDDGAPDGGPVAVVDGSSGTNDAAPSGDDGGSPGDDTSVPTPPGDDTTADSAPPGDDAAGDDGATSDDASGDDASVDAGDDGSVDAGFDAGPVDAGHDAGGHDAGHDAGPIDAGHDSGNGDAGCGTGTIVINEVQTSGQSGAEDEWVELYNPTGCPVDVSGWKLKHASINGTSIAAVFTTPSSVKIGPFGYAVIAGQTYSASAPTIGAFTTGVLADVGGGLGLYDATDTIVDSMGYGSGATNPLVETSPAPAGVMSESIARTPNGVETKNNANDFSIATTPTPGAKN
jgi:hypothetical protein